MTKTERAAVERLYSQVAARKAEVGKHDDHSEFYAGMEWGLNRALSALGYDFTARWELWHLATGHATRPDYPDRPPTKGD